MNTGTEREKARKDAARVFLGTVFCVVGILFAILGASNNVSARAVGAVLGQRRLAVAAIVIGVITVFFMAAASTGLIPGVTPVGHGYE